VLSILHVFARYGRIALVAGLLAGLLLPGLAATLKPFLPHFVVFLLFLTALRIGPKEAADGISDLRLTLSVVLVFQLALPLVVFGTSYVLGFSHSPYLMAVVLVLAAPALSGSPNFSILLGANPEPAFRLLVLGTAILPITMLPIFWLLPQMGDFQTAVASSGYAILTIGLAIALGFVLSQRFIPRQTRDQLEALDGAMTIAMVVIVVGLMAALRPAFERSPVEVFSWLVLAFSVNFGMQALTFVISKKLKWGEEAVPFSIVSGNRNVAIFLVMVSPDAAEPLLIFLGCYQIPMYLTPILMQRLYKTAKT
tara:strand:+ start:6491 stop:7420 length:930 start_codon:yes stop_codon:yes gene_type:complete